MSLKATYTNVATGFSVGLTAFITGRTDLSVWDFGDGDVEVDEPYTSHSWTAPGDYVVSLWAFNDSYPEGVSAPLTIHVKVSLHYVAAGNVIPIAPYTSWATAATNIQDAVDVAPAGATVFVTNGTYAVGGQVDPNGNFDLVVVDEPLTLQSVNGPGVTIIDGGRLATCVYLMNNAVLVGFTLSNGVAANGGGANGGTLNNCTLIGNLAIGYYDQYNDYIPGDGGGAYGGTLNNCTLTGNSASDGGGGAYGSTLNNCTVTGNSAPSYGSGGGVELSTLNNCTLTDNSARCGGGADGSTLNNCTLTWNSASDGGGGAYGSTLNNCPIIGNSGWGAVDSTLNNCVVSGNAGGGVSGDSWGGSSTLNNCTVTGNSGWGVSSATLNNCIVYFNTATNAVNYDPSSTLRYCCATPLPTNGVGNITSAPLFENYAGGNLRLHSNSPCINSGNNAYVLGSTDLDGNPRIVGGTVDMGAYEFQTPTSIISYAWLQQYGLPTDGSAEGSDMDGTGMTVYQDWIAGLNPTNALSVLKILAPSATNSPLGLVVTWQSVSGITYFLQSSTNLAGQPAFITIQSNIVGQAGTTSCTDTTATNAGPYFYRVGVGH